MVKKTLILGISAFLFSSGAANAIFPDEEDQVENFPPHNQIKAGRRPALLPDDPRLEAWRNDQAHALQEAQQQAAQHVPNEPPQKAFKEDAPLPHF